MVIKKNICSTVLPVLSAGSYPPTTPYDADIIILTRNRVSDTLEAVASALRQQNIRFHVSVLDQGSEPSIQTEFARAFRRHKNLGYHVIPGNLGVGGGRNFLSSLGNGKIIVGIDNDALFADAFVVARAVRAFETRPALGALGFKILSEDGIHLDEFSWGYPARLKKQSNARFDTTTFVGAGMRSGAPHGLLSAAMMRICFSPWEEYDFALRAIALGWSIQCDGSLAVIHKSPGKGG